MNLAFRQSFLTTKTGEGAYLGFLVSYALLALLTWGVYLRPAATHRQARVSASVEVAG